MCGILGIYDKDKNDDLIDESIYRLKLLQHRGKDSYGLSYRVNNRINTINNKSPTKM